MEVEWLQFELALKLDGSVIGINLTHGATVPTPELISNLALKVRACGVTETLFLLPPSRQGWGELIMAVLATAWQDPKFQGTTHRHVVQLWSTYMRLGHLHCWLQRKDEEHNQIHMKDKTTRCSDPTEDFKCLSKVWKAKQVAQHFRSSSTESPWVCGHSEIDTDHQQASEFQMERIGRAPMRMDYVTSSTKKPTMS